MRITNKYHTYFINIFHIKILIKFIELPQMEILARGIRQHAREEHRFGNLSVTNVSAEGKTQIHLYPGHNFRRSWKDDMMFYQIVNAFFRTALILEINSLDVKVDQ